MCETAKVKRSRSSVFSHLEKNSVTELVVKYNDMLRNKNPIKRNEAWSQIVEEFNRSPYHTKRTYQQIKKFYQNNKSEITKKINCANREETTGGESPIYDIKSSTTGGETTDSSYTNDIEMDDDFIKNNELIVFNSIDDLSEHQMVQFENYLDSELFEWGKEILTSTTVKDDTIPCKSQHPDDIEKEGDVSDPQNEIKDTITDASQNESVCNQQGKERKKREVKYVNKRKPIIKKSGDNKDELFKENTEDKAKMPSAVLAKQPEEECQIYTFFKSIAMSVKNMDLKFQIRARKQIYELICQLELDQYERYWSNKEEERSSSSDLAHSYLLPHDHYQQYAENRANLPSAVLTKQPEEECQIYTFFKSIAMSVKKMDLEFQIRARRQINEFICQLELDEYSSSSSLSSAHSYSVPHDDYQQPTSLANSEMWFKTDMSGDQNRGDIANVPIAVPSTDKLIYIISEPSGVFMQKNNHLDKEVTGGDKPLTELICIPVSYSSHLFWEDKGNPIITDTNINHYS